MDNEENNVEESVEDNEIADDTESAIDNEDSVDTGSEDYSGGYGQPVGYSPGGFGRGLVGGYNNARKKDNDLKENIEKNKSKNLPKGNANQDNNDDDNKESTSDKMGQKGVHESAKTAAGAVGGPAAAGAYETASKTKVGQAVEKKVANKVRRRFIIISIIVAAALFLLFFVFMGAAYIVLDKINNGDSNNNDVSSASCISGTYNGKTCETITVSGYGTMSLDDYVAGVVKSEVGVFNDLEMYKIGAIAARSFVLSHKSSSCVVNDTTERFQVFRGKGTDLSIQAANETSGIVLTKDGNIHNAMYDAFCWDSKDSQYYYVCQGHGGTTPVPIEWANRVVPRISGSSFLHSRRYRSHGQGLSQDAAYYMSTEQKKGYQEILDHFYGDEGVVLSSFGSANTSGCSSSNNGNAQTLSNYTLNHDGLKPLDRKLTSNEIDNFNNDINSAVNSAGYGTGAAVAAAGQTLAYDLEKLGYYLKYFLGDNYTNTGVNPNWDNSKGLDCSGFVSWAIINSCNKNFGDWHSDMFYQKFKDKKIDLKDAKPGDVMLLIEGNKATHIRLVIKNNGDGSIVTLEESFSSGGLVFKVIKSESNFITVDMSSYYSNSCSK